MASLHIKKGGHYWVTKPIAIFTLLAQVIITHEYKEQRKDQPNTF